MLLGNGMHSRPHPGSVVGLRMRAQGGGRRGRPVDWAGHRNPLLSLQYSAFTESDFDVIWDTYSHYPRSSLPDWFYKVWHC